MKFYRGEKFTKNFIKNFNGNFVEFTYRPKYRTISM